MAHASGRRAPLLIPRSFARQLLGLYDVPDPRRRGRLIRGYDVPHALGAIGERVHLATPHVDLSVHVDDVVNQVLYEDLTDIVLVGYSYGGMVVTGTLAHIAGRVRELVYLDAFVPADGQALTDVAGGGAPAGEPQLGAPWLVPPMPREFSDPQVSAWSLPRRTPQPLRTFTTNAAGDITLDDRGSGNTVTIAIGADGRPETITVTGTGATSVSFRNPNCLSQSTPIPVKTDEKRIVIPITPGATN